MKYIPKILHLYWGEAPMSWLQTRTITTFHKLNLDWEIRVYQSLQKNVDDTEFIPPYTGKDYFPLMQELPYVQRIKVDLSAYGIQERIPEILRSDILRYHLLYDVGGVWSDFDVLWLKPMTYMDQISGVGKVGMEDIGVSTCQFYLYNGSHGIGILLSRPNNMFYKTLIEECNKVQNALIKDSIFTHQMFGSDLFNVLYPDIRWTFRKCPDVVGIPYCTFYPYPTKYLHRIYESMDLSLIKKDTICFHWFNGHPLSKAYVNTNGMSRDCGMTRLIKKLEQE